MQESVEALEEEVLVEEVSHPLEEQDLVVRAELVQAVDMERRVNTHRPILKLPTRRVL